MSQSYESEANQQQQKPKIWQNGYKPGVFFSNLSTLQKYEIETAKLFNEDMSDGTEIDTPEAKFRVRKSKRFGMSITKWDKTKQEQQPQQQSKQEQLATGSAEYRERMSAMQSLLDELTVLQRIRRDTDSLIINLQARLRTERLI